MAFKELTQVAYADGVLYYKLTDGTWQEFPSSGGGGTLQQVLNSGSDISGASDDNVNDINIVENGHFGISNGVSPQLIIVPGQQYLIGDGGGDYGMGFLEFVTTHLGLNTKLDPGTGTLQINTDDLASATPTKILCKDDAGNNHYYNPEIDYQKYRCQLFQTGTNPPYDNTLGNRTLVNGGLIAWSYVSVGVYHGTFTGAFPVNLTRFVYSGYTPDGKFISVARVDNDTISVTQLDILNTGTFSDGIVLPFDLEIQVFATNSYND